MSPQLAVDPLVNRRLRVGIADLPHKPLDNPDRSKPAYSSDDDCAARLEQLLSRVPDSLEGDRRSSPFPLLDALATADVVNDTNRARELVFIAAVNHRTADERRTAEYLLRNRHAVTVGARSAKSLLFAARYAAEMDVRRTHRGELVVARALAVDSSDAQPARDDAMSAGDLVLSTLRTTVPADLVTPNVESALRIGVTVALDLADRYLQNGGRGSAIVAMRSNARSGARLAAILRKELVNNAASHLARLLVGPDDTELETALLRWSVRSEFRSSDIPETICSRWIRCLRALASALDDTPRYPQPSKTAIDVSGTDLYKSGRTDKGGGAVLDQIPLHAAHASTRVAR